MVYTLLSTPTHAASPKECTLVPAQVAQSDTPLQKPNPLWMLFAPLELKTLSVLDPELSTGPMILHPLLPPDLILGLHLLEDVGHSQPASRRHDTFALGPTEHSY